jgi:hypothetical protein
LATVDPQFFIDLANPIRRPKKLMPDMALFVGEAILPKGAWFASPRSRAGNRDVPLIM